MRLKMLALAVASVALSGCYRVTVTTGASPAPTVVEKPFQPSFVFGLVPPPELNVKDQCPNGVSQVVTEHSFLNGLIAGFTAQLFTPITVKVTCGNRR